MLVTHTKSRPVNGLKSLSVILFATMVLLFLPATAHAVRPGILIPGISVSTLVQIYDTGADTAAKLTPIDPAAHKPFKKIKRIVLDPGHGGSNLGAIGVAHEFEKGLTLRLAFSLRDELRRLHPEAEVVLTRIEDRDIDLKDRIEAANDVDADVFLSLHYNAAINPKALGYEVYHLKPDVQKAHCPLKKDECKRQRIESATLGRKILTSFGKHHENMKNRGLKVANFGVLRGAKMPALVVEVGFLTHGVEGHQVVTQGHREATVDAIIEALEAY